MALPGSQTGRVCRGGNNALTCLCVSTRLSRVPSLFMITRPVPHYGLMVRLKVHVARGLGVSPLNIHMSTFSCPLNWLATRTTTPRGALHAMLLSRPADGRLPRLFGQLDAGAAGGTGGGRGSAGGPPDGTGRSGAAAQGAGGGCQGAPQVGTPLALCTATAA